MAKVLKLTKTLIIAEAGVNHNGDINIAKKLIDKAVEAGVDIIKFQTFKTESLVSKTAIKAEYQNKNSFDKTSSTQYSMLKRLELDQEAHEILISYCLEKKIKFLSTAFDLESIDLLMNFGIEIFKIPSGEITNLPFLLKIGSLNKTVILSTGMSNLGEIEDALNVLEASGTLRNNIFVLHCNTEYPTPFEDVNLNAMITIQNAFKVQVGYSDHTNGIEIPIAAVALGAQIIEKHFTLNKTMEGPDHKASLEPHELKEMVRCIRNIELAMGNGIKKASISEQKNIHIARKSIYINKNLKAGHVISSEDVIMKRPGNGISPMLMDNVINKKLANDIEVDHQLTWSDFS